jgi:hypothetical protein
MSDWVPAVITGGLAASTAVFLAFLNRRAQRTAADVATAEHLRVETKLKQVEADLSGRSAVDAARREYEYAALNRLYSQVNPLIFQLRELCRGSSNRARRIVSTEMRVHDPEHLLTSTQRLFAPLVIVQEIQRNLTALDLRLDPTLSAQYQVAREILWNFHAGVAMSNTAPTIPYRTAEGYLTRRQHLTHAQLLRVVDYLSVEPAGSARGPMPQTQLDDAYAAGDAKCARALAPVQRLFDSSTPDDTPILWRILLCHAILLSVFADLVDRNASKVDVLLPPDIDAFAWPEGQRAFRAEVAAAEAFVSSRLRAAGVL